MASQGLRLGEGWPTNERCYPEVVGPGDETTVYLPLAIKSLNGMWRGTAQAWLVCADDRKRISAETKQSSWGASIQTDAKGNDTEEMWVRIGLPAEGLQAGEAVGLELSVEATYPFGGAGQFRDKTRSFAWTTELQVAGPGAGFRYERTWLFGLIAAASLGFVAVVWQLGLAWLLAKRGHPTAIGGLHVDTCHA